MNYILIGLLLGIGWHLATLIYDIATDLLFARLHDATWYQIAAGKRPRDIKSQQGDNNTVKNQIGFHYTQEQES